MKKILAFVIVAFIWGSMGSLKAAAEPNSTIVDFYGGLSAPLSQTDSEEKLGDYGALLGLGVIKMQGRYFGFGLDAMFTLIGSRNISEVSGIDLKLTPYAGTLMAVMRFTVFPDYSPRFYALAGAGANIFHAELKEKTASGSTSIFDEISTGLAYSFGVGIEADIGSHLLIGTEARWYRLEIEPDKFSGFTSSTYELITVAAKIGFKFGGK